MTVGELVALLGGFPTDAVVFTSDSTYGKPKAEFTIHPDEPLRVEIDITINTKLSEDAQVVSFSG